MSRASDVETIKVDITTPRGLDPQVGSGGGGAEYDSISWRNSCGRLRKDVSFLVDIFEKSLRVILSAKVRRLTMLGAKLGIN